MLPKGTLVRITTMRESEGVWWGRTQENPYGNHDQYADILIGPSVQGYGRSYAPPLHRWHIGTEQYMEVPEWDEEFLVAQAAHALAPPNSTN